jgi:HlyD family secretion protein
MKRVWIVAAILLAIAAGSAFVYFRIQPEAQSPQLVYGSGRIEADEVRVAPEVAGRLLENRAREGQTLRAGDTVARIDPVDYELQASQAVAQQVATRRSGSQIDAQIRLAGHHVHTARTDLARYEALRRKGWVTLQQVETRQNAYEAAVGQLRALREQRAQTDAQTDAAGRTLALARNRLGRTTIISPLSGSVLERLAEPGEVVAAGQPLAVIANLGRVRLRVFVSERDLGRIRLGAAARIRVDAFPDRFFDARVARVDAQAQFTPRDVHMEDERVRTVYGVTLEAHNREALLKPGMPADAWILWDSASGWPARLTVPE